MSDNRCSHVIVKTGQRCKLLAKCGEFCSKHRNKKIETCPVCFENINKNSKILSCGHMFHMDCILKWFVQSETCPVCRVEEKRDYYIKFKKLVEENMRERYKDAIESLEQEVSTLRRENRRRRFVVSDDDPTFEPTVGAARFIPSILLSSDDEN